MIIEEELALVARAQAGGRDAISALWDGITPKLYGYLVNTLREPNLAEDILQETWLKAISNLPKFRARGVRFSAWLFAIARNECRQHWRKAGREVAEEINEENHPSVLDSPEKGLTEKIFVEGLLKFLPPEDQEMLRLRYVADLSFKEIAAILAIAPITARVRAHRALTRARKILKNY